MNVNDGNDLENRLRSWTPRPPSPNLEARLFGAPAAARDRATAPRGVARWVTPALAAACSLVLATASMQQNLPDAARYDLQTATNSLRQPELVTYLDGRDHSHRNGIWRENFGWTNHAISHSSIGAFSLNSTNDSTR